MIDDKELIHKATDVINPRRLSPTVEVGGVAFILADIGPIKTFVSPGAK